jgi:hypothetical protein
MCSRHLPQSQPLTCLQAIQYVKPSRRLPKAALLTSAPIFSISRQFQPPAPCSMYSVAVSRSLGSSQLHCARDFQPGMFCTGATASVMILYHPRRGGSPSEESGTLRFFATRVCWTSTKRVSCRTETVAYPRRIRKAHRAPSTRSAFPCTAPSPSFPNSATAAAARPAAPHPRGSALHHLII